MSKYGGMKGVLYQFIVEFLKEHTARELLEIITDAFEEVGEHDSE